MRRFILHVLVILVLLSFAVAAPPSGADVSLPAVCGPGWIMDGKPARFNAENLYKYINGEAELYLPYGFDILAAGHYKGAGAPAKQEISVNLFTMGSLLDAFGIYGNYRGKGSEKVAVGGEGFIDDSQLMFYQDRYFVQISSSGQSEPDRSVYLSCARALAAQLPAGAGQPKELQCLEVPGLVGGSEKYYPQGLLGYAFLNRGLTAEAEVAGVPAKLFVAFAESPEGAVQALKEYDAYLKQSGAPGLQKAGAGGGAMSGTDPLYKTVLVKQHGRFLIGVTGLRDAASGESLIDGVIARLPRG